MQLSALHLGIFVDMKIEDVTREKRLLGTSVPQDTVYEDEDHISGAVYGTKPLPPGPQAANTD